jgi:cytochrome P450
VLEGITREKKAGKLEHGSASSSNDLITCLLSLTDDHGDQLLTDEEIVDNAMVALIAGHDTSSILMTFMVRQLANDPVTLAAMVQGKCPVHCICSLHNSQELISPCHGHIVSFLAQSMKRLRKTRLTERL